METTDRNLATRPVRLLAVLAALWVGGPAPAGDPAPGPLEPWLDAEIEAAMERDRVPGVVVGIVRAGRPAVLRGYGWASIEDGVPMDPERTVLPVASVSKLYTAATVLELVADGRLDLDADVASYVDGLAFRGAPSSPVTLRHLLTHTAGLDERNLGRYLPLDRADVSVRDYLLASMPPRIRPPGVVYQYSNHGMALAGLVAEEAAGVPFPDLVAARVYEPLGMTRSSFDPAAPRGATGYADVDGVLTPQAPHYVRTAYSGMMVSTAADQVRMLHEMLRPGTLATPTIDGLTSPRFRHGEDSPGTAFGTFEGRWAGRRYWWHEGQTRGFYAGFYVVPEAGLGLFVAYNRHHGATARRLLRVFLERELGPHGPESSLRPSRESTEALAERIEGTYRFVRHAHTTREMFFASMLGRAAEVTVRREDDGAFRVAHARFVHARDLVLVEPGIGAVNGFLPGDDGRARFLYYARNAFERIPWYARETVRDGWIAVSTIFGALSVLAWVVLAARPSTRGTTAARAGWLQAPGVLTQVGFLIAIVVAVRSFRGEAVFEMLFPWPVCLESLFFLPWLALALVPLQIVAATRVWRDPTSGSIARVHHLMVLLSTGAFLTFSYVWRLYAGIG